MRIVTRALSSIRVCISFPCFHCALRRIRAMPTNYLQVTLTKLQILSLFHPITFFKHGFRLKRNNPHFKFLDVIRTDEVQTTNCEKELPSIVLHCRPLILIYSTTRR